MKFKGKASPARPLALAAVAALGVALAGCGLRYGGYGSYYWDNAAAGAAAAGGAESGRIHMNQCAVDGTNGSSWDWLDSGVRALNDNGLAAVIRLDSCHSPNASGFTSFAANAVKRAAAVVQIRAVQVWNEPNYAANWGGKVDPAGYAKLFKSTYTAVKSVANVPVVSTGLGPLHVHPQQLSCSYNDSTWMCPHDFLNKFLSKLSSLHGHIDGVGANFFPIQNTAITADSALDNVQREYNQVDTVAQKSQWQTVYGSPPPIPIWGSEAGIRTDDATGDLSGADQGTIMMKSGNWLVDQPDLLALYVWNLIDTDTDLSTTSVPNYGVLTMSGDPKGGSQGAYCLAAKELGKTPSGC